MIKKGLLLLLIFSNSVVNATDIVPPSRLKYINENKEYAIRDMQKSGVPASITLAQALLESQAGCSRLAREANNHFGIKCSDWKGQTFIQDDDTKDECFRKYKSITDSYDDHSTFLRTRPRYAFLFELEITDYKGWARGLKKAGYATDPSYATSLIKIIEDNELYLLDQGKQPEFLADNSSSENTAIASNKRKSGSITKVFVPNVDVVDPFAPRKIKTINGVKYIVATSKDNFASLSKEFQMGSWQLPKYNEMQSHSSLSDGQIIYLQPKKNTGPTSTYIAKPGDTIASIAQANGIKTKYICKYNKLKESDPVEPGQRIYLEKVKR